MLQVVFMICVVLLFASETISGAPEVGDPVELTEDDTRQIRDQVLLTNPILSSSAGVKHASAQRSVRSTDTAAVIFEPHMTQAGVKHSIHVRCHRRDGETLWNCGEAKLRRYMQLEGQDFEMRISADINSDEALALVSATKAALDASEVDPNKKFRTAINIYQLNDGDLYVNWGVPEGYVKLTLAAKLRNNGDPADPNDWMSEIYILPE